MNPTDFHTETYYRSAGRDNGGELKAGKEKAGKRCASRLVLTSLSNTSFETNLSRKDFMTKHSRNLLVVASGVMQPVWKFQQYFTRLIA
ncbi:hypothetical protein MX551_004042 [Salmonella enterica]|nr:hypothetical protein [Salmonella enterica]EDR4377406.1 hypothetical protein [Salmonella enterica]EEG5734285.1 hypothetical protein [Salmonella enterica]EEG6158306.1 hypothetical protein [Salmonella enterica]EEH7434637.1 hypothetical protein [Salmonella enterica]